MLVSCTGLLGDFSDSSDAGVASGGGAGAPAADAGADADAPWPDSGGAPDAQASADFGYVADHVFLPSDDQEALAYGFDLDGNGSIDNQLGKVLATLTSQGGSAQARARYRGGRGQPRSAFRSPDVQLRGGGQRSALHAVRRQPRAGTVRRHVRPLDVPAASRRPRLVPDSRGFPGRFPPRRRDLRRRVQRRSRQDYDRAHVARRAAVRRFPGRRAREGERHDRGQDRRGDHRRRSDERGDRRQPLARAGEGVRDATSPAPAARVAPTAPLQP